MNVNTRIMGLDRMQADGLACVVCGASYLQVATPHVPVGRSETDSQVFACVACQAAVPECSPWPSGVRRELGLGGVR